MKQYRMLLALLLLSGCSGRDSMDISASGTIEGTEVNVGAEVAGKVKELFVDEGSRVSIGDTLCLIDDSEYSIQLRQALANLASFESAFRLMVEGSRKEDIVQAEAAFNAAEADYRRMKDLLVSQTITQKQYDDAYAKYVTTQQALQKLQNGSRPEEVEGARQKRDYASAQADLLKKKIRDCRVLAPCTGIVTLKSIERGELVTVGARLFRITFLEKVKLTIYVNELELGRVKLGQKAKVSTDADKNKSFDGTVVYISPTAEFTPKNIQTKEERTKMVFGVKIELANPDGALKPGLPADARILTATNSGSEK